MKAFLKSDHKQVGEVTRVWVTDTGQKRMEVRFSYSLIDADVSNFELMETQPYVATNTRN